MIYIIAIWWLFNPATYRFSHTLLLFIIIVLLLYAFILRREVNNRKEKYIKTQEAQEADLLQQQEAERIEREADQIIKEGGPSTISECQLLLNSARLTHRKYAMKVLSDFKNNEAVNILIGVIKSERRKLDERLTAIECLGDSEMTEALNFLAKLYTLRITAEAHNGLTYQGEPGVFGYGIYLLFSYPSAHWDLRIWLDHSVIITEPYKTSNNIRFSEVPWKYLDSEKVDQEHERFIRSTHIHRIIRQSIGKLRSSLDTSNIIINAQDLRITDKVIRDGIELLTDYIIN